MNLMKYSNIYLILLKLQQKIQMRVLYLIVALLQKKLFYHKWQSITYIRLFEIFNTITFDMVQKLFETMNQFNSQQQQLILGAGAVAFGKMKTISAKNLAISSTSLRFFLTILDPISNKLLRIINQFLTEKPDYAESINVASVSVELNKIKTDYFNHNAEIVSKLTSQLWNDQLKLIIPTKYTSRSFYQAVDEILIYQDTIFQSIFGYLKQDYLKTFRNISINTKISKNQRIILEFFTKSIFEIGKLQTFIGEQLNEIVKDVKDKIDSKEIIRLHQSFR